MSSNSKESGEDNEGKAIIGKAIIGGKKKASPEFHPNEFQKLKNAKRTNFENENDDENDAEEDDDEEEGEKEEEDAEEEYEEEEEEEEEEEGGGGGEEYEEEFDIQDEADGDEEGFEDPPENEAGEREEEEGEADEEGEAILIDDMAQVEEPSNERSDQPEQQAKEDGEGDYLDLGEFVLPLKKPRPTKAPENRSKYSDSTPKNEQFCEICSDAKLPAKYKCPGCLIRYCSVACFKEHISKDGCTGARSKTHFVDVSQFNDDYLLSGK